MQNITYLETDALGLGLKSDLLQLRGGMKYM